MPSPLEATVSEVDLPVIDISEFPNDLIAENLSQLRDHPVLAKLRKACEEWGFFYLVNHGIPVEILEKSQNASQDLLSLPAEAKDKATTSKPIDSYYRSPNYETFGFPDSVNSDSIAQMCFKIWPEGNVNFWLSHRLNSSIIVWQRDDGKLRFVCLKSFKENHRNNSSKPGVGCQVFLSLSLRKMHNKIAYKRLFIRKKKVIGDAMLPSHTDSACLTILYQDGAGGLQIRSQEGEWFNVKPLPHSFLINVGDSLKAWTNGGYRSAEHRVICKGWIDRMSLAFFTVFPMETEIWAPAELVDDNNPRLYKPFIFAEFRQELQTNKEYKDTTAVLERFAGI